MSPSSQVASTSRPCRACSLLCDDIALQNLADAWPTDIDCSKGAAWWKTQQANALAAPRTPTTESLSSQLDTAKQLLASAKRILLTGFRESSLTSVRLGLSWAEQLRAVFDPNLSESSRTLIRAMQETGLSTCTLGELHQRADLVVFCAPSIKESHPRFAERFLSSSRSIDLFPYAEELFAPDRALRTFRRLRCDLAARKQKNQPEIAGHEFADRLTRANFSVFLSHPEYDLRTVIELVRLIAELQHWGRSHLLLLHGSISPACRLVTQQTGFPFAVDFKKGYPEYRPIDGTTEQLLLRRHIDLVIIVGKVDWPESIHSCLRDLKLLVISDVIPEGLAPTVFLPTSSPLSEQLMLDRCDGVVLKSEPFIAPGTSSLLSEYAMIKELFQSS